MSRMIFVHFIEKKFVGEIMKTLSFLVVSLVALVSCSGQKITKHDQEVLKSAQGFFSPIPSTMIDKEKHKDMITLGKKLYLEKKLSANGTISCNSCHKLDNFGVDNEPTSPGHDGTRGGRNSPTSFNAALNFKQFWDGRAKDLADQAGGPILNPIEHGLKSEKEALAKINEAEYIAMFKKAFPKAKEPMTYKNLTEAIAAFEKTLMTPSRFDAYLAGDIAALNAQERKGLEKFVSVGCIQCHSGQGLGGTSFQKLGLVKPYKTKDMGRYEVTKKRRDKFKFKVPLLRNIEKTAPYFHDGSIKTLDEAITVMAEYQLGKELAKEDVSDIKAFLGSLTGELQ
jgi:cytochrome c peroxidase